MDKRYLNYSFEELINDELFVAWVVRGEHRESWEHFMEEHGTMCHNLSEAYKTLSLLKQNDAIISPSEELRIWKNIESFERSNSKRVGGRSFRLFFQIAAVMFLGIMIAGGTFKLFFNQPTSYQYRSSVEDAQHQDAQLILSNGQKVKLERENSKVAMQGDNKVVIDNQKVIDLDDEEASQMNEVAVPYGKKSQLILEDGTKVWLNAGSRMAFPTKFKSKLREVFLEGEGYFEVAKNAAKPFVVNTGEMKVKVLGTKFDIAAYKQDAVSETVLLEGKVQLSLVNEVGIFQHDTFLAPNEKAQFNRSKKMFEVSPEPDADFAIAWTEGWFKFSQQNLSVILAKLKRFYNVEFIPDGEMRTGDLISGKLDLKESIDKVLIALSGVADLQFRVDGSKIYLHNRIERLNQKY